MVAVATTAEATLGSAVHEAQFTIPLQLTLQTHTQVCQGRELPLNWIMSVDVLLKIFGDRGL